MAHTIWSGARLINSDHHLIDAVLDIVLRDICFVIHAVRPSFQLRVIRIIQ